MRHEKLKRRDQLILAIGSPPEIFVGQSRAGEQQREIGRPIQQETQGTDAQGFGFGSRVRKIFLHFALLPQKKHFYREYFFQISGSGRRQSRFSA